MIKPALTTIITLFIVLTLQLYSFDNLSDEWITVDSIPYIENVVIDCVDSLNCISMSKRALTEPFVSYSSDAGETWTLNYVDTLIAGRWENGVPKDIIHFPDFYFWDLDFVSIDLIVASTNKKKIAISKDLGKTWNLLPPANDNKLSSVKMFNKNLGYYSDVMGNLYITDDACNSWNELKISDTITTGIIDIMIPDSNSVYLRRGRNQLMLSENKGQTWILRSLPYFCSSIEFINKKIGFAGGSIQADTINNLYPLVIYKTTDAGINWLKIMDTLIIGFGKIVDFSFIDENNGIAIGEFETVLRTTDSGDSWKFDFKNSYENKVFKLLKKCIYHSYNSQLITGYFSTIYRFNGNQTDLSEQTSSLINNTIILSPNPASDYIEITVGAHHDVPNQLAIFDQLGIEQSTPSVLRTATPQEGNLRIDVSSLSPGVYFVRVGDEVRKFVKM